MLKPVIAATALLAIAGTSVVYAQQRFDGNGFGQWGHRGEHRHHHHRPSADDMAAFTDARIAALKAGLELTPDQQKNWPAFEQALRDMAQLRMQRIEARQQGGATQPSATPQQGATPQTQAQNGPFGRLEKRADAMAKRSAALKKLADAGAPLYASLTDAQKERFHTLARVLRPHPRMRMAFNERGAGWRQGGRGSEGGQGGHGMGQGGPGFGPSHHRFGHGGRGGDGDGGSQL